MKTPRQAIELLDYKQEKASHNFVPQPPKLASSGWNDLHLEFHQQPKFETTEHQHNMHVIALGFSNSPGERWLDGKIQKERRNRGDIAIIPAGITHCCNWNNIAKFGILAIEPTLLAKVGRDLVEDSRIELIPQFMNEPDELIKGVFSTFKNELKSNNFGSSLLFDSLKSTLAIYLLEKYCKTKPKLSIYKDGLSQTKLRQITEYINEHLDSNLKVCELAAIAEISPYHFIRLFKSATNKTPHQYVLCQRIETAKYLLKHKDSSISAIASTVGFCDQSHFAKYFKRIVGVTPKQYRK